MSHSRETGLSENFAFWVRTALELAENQTFRKQQVVSEDERACRE
jgi:hypothetical protein